MRRLGLLIVVLMMLSVLPLAVHAQACDTAALSEDVAAFRETARTIKEGEPLLALMAEIQAWYDIYTMPCQQTTIDALAAPGEPPSHTFTSLEEGMQTVIGPVSLPDGFYRLRAASAASYSEFRVDARDGICKTYPSSPALLEMGTMEEGVPEYLFEARNCTMLMIVDTIYSHWRLDFYPLDVDEPSPVQTSYSSDVLGLFPVIGPLVFEDGRYTMTLVSDDPPYIYLYPISGNCSGSDDNVAFPRQNLRDWFSFKTEGCVAILMVKDFFADAAWQIQFEYQPE